MRRIWFVVLVLLVFVGVGCSRIPPAIRTEIDFLHTVVSTGIREANQLEEPAERADKALRALRRAEPHTENLLRWAEGRDIESASVRISEDMGNGN